MGAFTWGRIAGLAGLGLVTAGIVYLVKTEKGRALVEQARLKGRELWLKARETAGGTTDALQETTTAALTEGQEAPVEQPA